MRCPASTSPLHSLFHVTLTLGVLAGLLAVTPGTTAAASLLEPEDGTYEATITRTAYGIPHIEAQDYGSLGFGQGYGAAEDIMCSLMDTIVTVRGERSKFFGPDERYQDGVSVDATNLQADTVFGDIVNRGVVEDLLASDDIGVTPGEETRAMVRGYVTGVNQYLEDVGGADGISDPVCAGADWVRPVTALDLWRGIYAAQLLASTGVMVPLIADADPPNLAEGDLGLPDLSAIGDAIGIPLPELPTADASGFRAVPEQLPTAEQLRERLGSLDTGFGSNGTALGSSTTATGRGMVLGNPHFPWYGRYRFTQSQLTIPGEYDVRGGLLHGSPVVNIGWNDDVAWTHTVSTAYRFTPYEYRLVPGVPTQYVSLDGSVVEVERREVEVELPDGSTVTEDLYRTPEGYVIDDQAGTLAFGLLSWTPISVWAMRDANAEHLKTLDVFHEMGKATDTQELAAAQLREMGIPWVNTMAADRDGNALYADNSVVPHVTDAQVQQCGTLIGLVLFELVGLPGLNGNRAAAGCAWGSDDDAPRDGIFGEANLPDVTNDTWVVNANDSYWLPNPDTPLTGFARIIGCEECERSLRTRMVYRYVLDRLDGSDGLGGADEFTHQQLMQIQTENRVFAAELAREDDDLQDVCVAAGVDSAACDALASWDGRTDTDSRGALLFREFWTESGVPVWEEAFDASRPVETPRDLDESDQGVIDAMTAAVAALGDAGIAHDAELGSQQVAGDDGAAAIPIHGGLGSTGNANAVSFGSATANTDKRWPVSYGSSHIQAVAFTDEDVDACTILTYSQAYDQSSPHHDDQTALWAGEEWVCWPDDVKAAAITTRTVSGEVPGSGSDTAGGGDDQLASTGGGSAAMLGAMLLAGAVLGVRRRRG